LERSGFQAGSQGSEALGLGRSNAEVGFEALGLGSSNVEVGFEAVELGSSNVEVGFEALELRSQSSVQGICARIIFARVEDTHDDQDRVS